MQSSESIATIAPALIAAQAEFSHVAKGGYNKFDKYDYATLEDYVDAVKQVLSKHDLAITSSVDAINRLPDRTTKNGGTEHAVEVAGTMRVIHSSGEWIEASFRGEGQDRADKSVYKAITGGRKYGIAALFSLATSDDPEADEQVGQSQGPTKKPAQQRHLAERYTVRGPVEQVERHEPKPDVVYWMVRVGGYNAGTQQQDDADFFEAAKADGSEVEVVVEKTAKGTFKLVTFKLTGEATNESEAK